jgi:hypothetical protein
MEGGHLRLVEKEIQHLDLKWMVKIGTYIVTYKQAQKQSKLFLLFQGMLLWPNTSQNPAKIGDLFL